MARPLRRHLLPHRQLPPLATATTAADVDRLDRSYLDYVTEHAALEDIKYDPGARARKQQLEELMTGAAGLLVAAITDHDLAVYGELLPEETP